MPRQPKVDQNTAQPRTPTEAKTPTADPLESWGQSGRHLTTAHGLRLPDTDHWLKAGEPRPTLLEDFHLREKITHFDRERALLLREAFRHCKLVGVRGVRLHRAWDRAVDVMSSAVPPSS
jgi:hypothetical protein